MGIGHKPRRALIVTGCKKGRRSFSLGQGPTFNRVAEYLRTFGGRFVIIEADASAVISREQQWTKARQNPALNEDFLKLLALNWDGRAEMSVGILLDTLVRESDFFVNIKALHSDQKQRLKQLVDKQRQRYRTHRGARQTLDNVRYSYSARGFITENVMLELSREYVRTNDEFTLTDGLDFFHAVVSISYCTHVVLDKKWARRCRTLNLPKHAASLYDGTQMHELLATLDAFG